jgi:predicted SAM-dependent methyltransferase
VLSRAYEATLKVNGSVRAAFLRRAARRRVRSFAAPYKLHLGCGTIRLPGWINIDVNANRDVVDLQWDLTRTFPLPANSCRYIYSEHVMEHFDVSDGVSILKECHRLLMPGGVLRIAMPSLKDLIASYESPDWRQQEWLSRSEYQFIATPAEMLNISFRWWGHRWLYDFEELQRRMRDAGFVTISPAPWGDSGHASLRSLESRRDSKLICEAQK